MVFLIMEVDGVLALPQSLAFLMTTIKVATVLLHSRVRILYAKLQALGCFGLCLTALSCLEVLSQSANIGEIFTALGTQLWCLTTFHLAPRIFRHRINITMEASSLGSVRHTVFC